MKKKMMALLLVVCLGINLLGTLAVNADEADGLEYTISDGKVTIDGASVEKAEIIIPAQIEGYPVTAIADEAFCGADWLEKVTIPDSVTSIGEDAFTNSKLYDKSSNWTNNVLYIGNYLIKVARSKSGSYNVYGGTTTIADGAFAHSEVTSVVIPDSVQNIGKSAFYQCIKLKSVRISKSVTVLNSSVFYDCEELTDITYYGTLTEIGNSAFAHCSKLKEAPIGEGLKSIGNSAFFCSALSNPTLPSTLESIGSSAFENIKTITSITIPESVTKIGSSTFYNCTELQSINLPSGLTTINSGLFGNCNKITSLKIPEGVTKIGSSAFYNCTSLRDINIPSGVTSIGSEAFYSCKALTSLTLPENITRIEDATFKYCTSLRSINIPENVTYIGNSAFANCGIVSTLTIPEKLTSLEDWAFANCGSMRNFTIPETLTNINSYVFYGCEGLQKITLPDSIKSLGEKAFYGCTSLKSVTLSENLKTIGPSAFYNCSSLSSIDFPDSLTTIGEYAFYGCTTLGNTVIPEGITTIPTYCFFDCESMKEVTIPNSVTTIAVRAFSDCSNLETAYYGGTAEDWEKITIGSYNNNIKKTQKYYYVICTFANDDGTVVAKERVVTGDVITLPEPPTKEATVEYTYTFDGWDGYEEGMTASEYVTFTAKYASTINQYTYKFVDEDGTVIAEETVDYGTIITAPESPSKAASQQYTYTFGGWDGYEEGMTVTEDVTFTAKYTSTINQYTYKFVDEDGTVISEETVDYGTIITAPESPSKADSEMYTYAFSGWAGYEEGMTVTEDITFTAQFTESIKRYTYKFISDGNMILEETVDHGTIITAPENPSKAATQQYTYTFIGWENYEESMVATADITFTAIYTETVNRYTYKFVDEDGKVIIEETADYGTVIKKPADPKKPATQQYTYTFGGWNGYEEEMILTKDITFTAKYNAVTNQYTYKFIDEDGKVISEKTADYGTVIKKPADPKKPATAKYTYAFSGWDGYKSGMELTKDITFTAEYTSTINKYTYKFVDYDGKVVSQKTADYGTRIEAPGENPYRDETAQYIYTFDGWKDYRAGMTLEADITFDAVYLAETKKYTYKFLDEDGTLIFEDTANYGTTIIPPAEPEKAGTAKYSYPFAGWKGYETSMVLTGDVTFTATYTTEINKYTYKFVDSDGGVVLEKTVEYGTLITESPRIYLKEHAYSGEWKGYVYGMSVTEDLTFNLEFEYHEYQITVYDTNKSFYVQYGNDYHITPNYKSGYKFMGYYDGPDGTGTKITDENGYSYAPFTDDTPRTIYSYLVPVDVESGQIMIDGTSEAFVGSNEPMLHMVVFTTDKDAKTLSVTVRFPKGFSLYRLEAVDFDVVNETARVSTDEYTDVTINCSYKDEEAFIPKNEKINPFNIKFKTDISAGAGIATISIPNASVIGDEEYVIENKLSHSISLKYDKAVSMKIAGDDVIAVPTTYTLNVAPYNVEDKSAKWSVDNEEIATVDQNGVLTPIKDGEVLLVARLKSDSNVVASKKVLICTYAPLVKYNSYDEGIWNKPFDPRQTEYTIYISGDVDATTTQVIYTGGELYINGEELWPSEEYKPIYLTERVTELTLTRSGVDGATDRTYKVTYIKGDEINVDISEDKSVVDVYVPGAYVELNVLVAYFKDKRLVGWKNTAHKNEKITFEINSDYDTLKVFAWKKLDKPTPILPAKTVKFE